MEKKYIKTFESFRNSKNTEPVNEELLGAIGRAVGAIFKKGKELINKAKGGKEVEAIYQKYLKMVQDQFASQAKVALNIMASEKGAAKPIQNAAAVIPKKESVDFKNSDKLFEADANTKLAVDTLKQKKAALDQILQKLKASALKEMDAILKTYGGSAKNPKLDLLIQSKKDEFDLAYLNAQISYLEQAGDTTMVTAIKKERDGIATKIEKELAQADTAVAVEYKEGDEVIHLLKGKTKENYDPKKKPEDQKDVVGVHKISKIEGDKYTLLDDEEKPTIIITGAELVGKPAEVPGAENKSADVLETYGVKEEKELVDKDIYYMMDGYDAKAPKKELIGKGKVIAFDETKGFSVETEKGNKFDKSVDKLLSKVEAEKLLGIEEGEGAMDYEKLNTLYGEKKDVIYLLPGVEKDKYDSEKKPDEQTEVVGVGQIVGLNDQNNDKSVKFEKDGKTIERSYGDIVGVIGDEDKNEEAKKAAEELGMIKDDPEKMKNVSSYAEFLRKGKPDDVDTIKSMIEDELGKLPKE